MKDYILNSNISIPSIGFGTWYINNKDVVQSVKSAIDAGYRHIDTAQAYRNEKGVGQGIKLSSVKREEIFITTKLAAEIKDYDKALKAIDKSIKALDVDYIDLMIIHSPQPWTKFRSGDNFNEGNIAAYKALEEAKKQGKIKAIGLSNFQEVDVKNILDNCDTLPDVNQVLAHIGNMPFDLIDYCNENNILVQAYSPIAHGKLLGNKEVLAIAKKYDVSLAQLCIAYLLQKGLLPLPKTTNESHMKSNLDINFEINTVDMLILDQIKMNDYGDSSDLPVYGGQLNFKTLIKMILGKVK